MTAETSPQGSPPGRPFEIGPIRFDPATGELAGPGGRERLDLKVAGVLIALQARIGEVVSREELLASVWPGLVVTDDVLRRCIYQLRNHLGRTGGDPDCKSLLETLPKRGYLLHAGSAGGTGAAGTPPRARRRWLAAAALAVGVVAAAAWLASGRDAGDGRPSTAMASIAVLPFDDLSDAQDQQYFADGLAEEILNLLAQLPELRVIARTSSFSFQGRDDLDIPEIGRRLGVTHILEGSVRRSGGRVRVTAQLVRSRDGSHVWSRAYDRNAADVLDMQRDIAASVARTLEIRFAQPAGRAGIRAVDPAAHEQYLLARFLSSRRSTGDLAMAQEHLERAVAVDPGHAQAWALLSGIRYIRIFEDGEDPEAALEAMRIAVGRALALAPESGEVHARAVQFYDATGDFERAAEHWQRARALAPNNMLVISFTGSHRRGDFAEALRQSRRVVELDPVNAVSRYNLAAMLMINGRYDEASREIQRVRQLNPGSGSVEELAAELLVLRGRHAEALEAALALPAGPDRERLLVLAYGGLGRAADAEAAFAALRVRGDGVSLRRIADIHAWRGEPDAAFEWLDRAWRAASAAALVPGEREGPMDFLDSAFLRPLHDDPRLARYFVRLDRDTSTWTARGRRVAPIAAP
jgi:serine/threonine-protein kinase